MTEPVTTEPDPDPFAETDDEPVLPVEIDLEDPEADTLDQAIPVLLDVEGYPRQ
jgi:hypothetical protein